MRIIFCQISYLDFYDGRASVEYTRSADEAEKLSGKELEKRNFLNLDGRCYGYLSPRREEIRIERMEKVYRNHVSAEDVTVIWCARHPVRGRVIVGWYEHATVYRYEHKQSVMWQDDSYYYVSAKAEDVYLLPEKKRIMEIDRTGEAGAEEEFEKRNYWFPKSDFALERTVPAVLRYTESRRDQRINAMTADFMQPEKLKPLTQKEEVILRRRGNDVDADLKLLYLAYRKYAREPDEDNAYRIAVVLNELLQFSMAIPWFEKVVRSDPDDLTSKAFLMLTYYQCEKVEEARKAAEELLAYTDDEDFDYKIDVYIRLSDCCYSKGEDREAVYWLDRIIEESDNPDYVKYVEGLKKIRMLQIDD